MCMHVLATILYIAEYTTVGPVYYRHLKTNYKCPDYQVF